jgi:hypothetical protein
MLSGKRIRNRGAELLRGVAGRLSAPRDEALVATAQSAYVLVTGHRLKAGISAYREPRIDTVALRQAEAALDRGDTERAMVLGDRLYRDHPKSVRVLRLRRAIFSRIGDLRSQAAMLHEIHLLDDIPENHQAERGVVGRLNELTPGWLPWIPGRRPVTPIDDATVLHLNKESTPYLTTGFTMR